ncbi:helix-turn-helix domain-containing protein [Clostridium sp. BL-8]|uniref:helix-turn-helix domain-containing protein n=1 Tax=Clostridium sp. BL-8 TaxID=349938 RepID=UPI00098CA1AB|nr:helix-turn-helix domain-containing protein [Clostridium sp. BL-8]OOM76219.1 hypothetical protein CLOBL_36640 [Clostridium sp. BL-8]
MNSETNTLDIQDENIMQNKRRGDILYYSLSQVADLLGEEDSSIRYYTNVFDNILKIEISNKEFRYTNKDVDKLEFLINLKNKGMSIKEVQKYCEELPLDIQDLLEVKEDNSLSAKEIISSVIELESEKINNIKDYLSNKIDESNALIIQQIIESIIKEQNKQLDIFKNSIINEIKDYIDLKFNTNVSMDSYSELSERVNTLIDNRILFENNVNSQLNNLNESFVTNGKNLADEIKRFKNIIERAYYVQEEIASQKSKQSFLGRLFGTKY